jgi:hypothetical protein
METGNFRNDGFGWVCIHCEAMTGSEGDSSSRLMREGEAESKSVTLSTNAIAKWADAEHTILICPRCERTERVRQP